jgi:hypothetical protein
MAVVVLDDPEADGWPGDFTFELRQRINRLAVQIGLGEYVTLLTEEDFAARDQPEDEIDAPDIRAIREVLGRDRRPRKLQAGCPMGGGHRRWADSAEPGEVTARRSCDWSSAT